MKNKKIYIKKDKLYQLYIEENLSVVDLARIFSCSPGNISYYIKKYDILKRKFQIERNKHTSRFINIDKEKLIEEYIVNKKTIPEIAKVFGVSSTTINNRIREYGIIGRQRSDLLEDLTGHRFGFLVVKESTNKRTKNDTRIWLCKCDCGNYKEIHTGKLKSGEVRTCGVAGCKCKGSRKGYEGIYGTHWNTIQKAAMVRNLEFSITIEYAWMLYVQQDGKCALSGIPIKMGTRKSTKSASLDRIDSSKGYIEKNVQWVHKQINLMKRSMEQKDFIILCGNIWEHSKWQLDV